MSTTVRLSLAEYDRMIACGVFDRRERLRLELIHGELRDMAPIGPDHEDILDLLLEWSMDEVPRQKIRVRVQNSIGFPPFDSAPEPDLVWVVKRSYRRGRPTAGDVLLVIEIADSSLRYDCGEKAALYAAAGIADYWVVNVPDRLIEVRRDPEQDGYRSIRAFRGEEEIQPLAVPGIVLRPTMLWPA